MRTLLRGTKRSLLGICVGWAVVSALPSAAWAAPTITEFVSGSGPQDVTGGPDGNAWLVESGANKIGRMTPAGVLTEFSTGLSSGAGLTSITAGPDGNLWFTESTTSRIGRITPTGTIKEFSLGITAGSAPHGITAGPDGNLWFTETTGNRIGRITTAGLVTEFSAGITAARNPYGITAGPDGNLWFTEHASPGGIGRITTAGAVTEFTPTMVGQPAGIATGSDGNLWFAESKNPGAIGRLTPTGVLTEFTANLTHDGGPEDITAADDGNLYFTESHGAGAVGKITTAGVISEFTATLKSAPLGIGIGGDGNVWFAESAGARAGRLTVAPGATTAPAVSLTPTGASLAATVSPNSQPTTYVFDWGLTTAYGNTTTSASAGSGASAAVVTFPVSGLTPLTTYHYRVKATNASGTTVGADQFFTTPLTPLVPPSGGGGVSSPPTPLPPVTGPVLGRSATLTRISGTVRVKVPGSLKYVRLTAATTVPVGTTIDARAGTVRLKDVRDRSGKLQTGTFWGGAFTFRQARKGGAMTVLTLTPPSCTRARRLATLNVSSVRVRHLWAKDNHGRFVTRGRSAVATVRGTNWLTQDDCRGTLVRVRSGSVSVRDLVRKRTVIVSAGKSYRAHR
jgi:streptogramin lyase